MLSLAVVVILTPIYVNIIERQTVVRIFPCSLHFLDVSKIMVNLIQFFLTISVATIGVRNCTSFANVLEHAY